MEEISPSIISHRIYDWIYGRRSNDLSILCVVNMDVIDVKEELKKFQVNFIYFYPCLEKHNNKIKKINSNLEMIKIGIK